MEVTHVEIFPVQCPPNIVISYLNNVCTILPKTELVFALTVKNDEDNPEKFHNEYNRGLRDRKRQKIYNIRRKKRIEQRLERDEYIEQNYEQTSAIPRLDEENDEDRGPLSAAEEALVSNGIDENESEIDIGEYKTFKRLPTVRPGDRIVYYPSYLILFEVLVGNINEHLELSLMDLLQFTHLEIQHPSIRYKDDFSIFVNFQDEDSEHPLVDIPDTIYVESRVLETVPTLFSTLTPFIESILRRPVMNPYARVPTSTVPERPVVVDSDKNDEWDPSFNSLMTFISLMQRIVNVAPLTKSAASKVSNNNNNSPNIRATPKSGGSISAIIPLQQLLQVWTRMVVDNREKPWFSAFIDNLLDRTMFQQSLHSNYTICEKLIRKRNALNSNANSMENNRFTPLPVEPLTFPSYICMGLVLQNVSIDIKTYMQSLLPLLVSGKITINFRSPYNTNPVLGTFYDRVVQHMRLTPFPILEESELEKQTKTQILKINGLRETETWPILEDRLSRLMLPTSQAMRKLEQLAANQANHNGLLATEIAYGQLTRLKGLFAKVHARVITDR